TRASKAPLIGRDVFRETGRPPQSTTVGDRRTGRRHGGAGHPRHPAPPSRLRRTLIAACGGHLIGPFKLVSVQPRRCAVASASTRRSSCALAAKTSMSG